MKIAVFGIQGSGKSTQADLLATHYGLPHIETGELVRKYSQNQDAADLKESLAEGQLSPTDLVVKLLKERLALDDCREGYVLDGYPRSIDQYNAFAPDLDMAIHIKISDEEAVKRLLARGRDDDTSQAIDERLELYHSETEPVLKLYEREKILEEVDGERSIEEIQKDLVGIIERSLKVN